MATRAVDPTYRMLVVADFGGSRHDGLQGLTLQGEVPGNLPSQLGVGVGITVPNLLGSTPDPMPVEAAVNKFSDLSAKALRQGIEPLRRAAALRAAVAGGLRDFASYPDLDRLTAGIGPIPATRASRPLPAASDVDRLLSMLDLGGTPSAQPTPAWSVKEAVTGMDRLIAQQLALVQTHPRWAALEGAWRGLLLVTGQRGLPPGLRVDLVDTADPASTLVRDLLPDELEQAGSERPGCILVGGAIPGTPDGLEWLALCAAAGAALEVPVLVSLAQDFFDKPDPVMQAGWDLLRTDGSAAWLTACLGDVVLAAEGREEPLWGEPAWAVAALAVQSLAQTGSPAGLDNPSVAVLEGMEVHEMTGRAGPTAWALRRPLSRGDAASLGTAGVLTLAAHPNRDRLFLPAAPCLAADVSLGAALASAYARAGES